MPTVLPASPRRRGNRVIRSNCTPFVLILLRGFRPIFRERFISFPVFQKDKFLRSSTKYVALWLWYGGYLCAFQTNPAKDTYAMEHRRVKPRVVTSTGANRYPAKYYRWD